MGRPERLSTRQPLAGAEQDHVDEDWRWYSGLDRLVNHWDRPGWTQNRHSYHWLIALDDPALRELTTRCQEALRDLSALDLVPLSSLHVTLERVGFTDEMAERQARATAKLVTRSCRDVEPFALSVGPLAGSTGAVRFSAGPHEPILRLRNAARAAVERVSGPRERTLAPDRAFRPHVSIAYSRASISAQPVIAQVGRLRALGSVTVSIRGIQLVDMWREGRAYRWRTLADVDLGTSRDTGRAGRR